MFVGWPIFSDDDVTRKQYFIDTDINITTLHYYYSAHSLLGLFSDRLLMALRLLMLLTLPRLFNIFTTIVIIFLTVFILTHPVDLPCGRKPEKTTTFSRALTESVAWIEPRSQRWKALALTTAPPKPRRSEATYAFHSIKLKFGQFLKLILFAFFKL
jgi:hypothetical protein